MKKNWKKLFSVLLLAALLCALPGTLAWATDISAITPDGPAGNQVVEDQTAGSQTGGTRSDGTGSGTSTGTDTTTGGNSGSTGSGTSTEGSGATSGDTGGAGTGTGSGAGTTGDTGTSGSQTSGTGSGSSTGTGGTTGGSTTSDTTTGQSGSDSGSTAATEATPTPTVTPTPTATPTPTPTPSKPVITKDPTDETVDVGGDCWFIAYSDAPYAVWHFVSPDGKTDYRYDAQEIAKAFPGLQIENGNRDSLHLVNIPAEMNGWRAGCEFRNDIGSVRSGYAVVHVNGAPAATPSPSPSATPTAKPSPTPTPAATTTPAPTSVPIATPSPVVSPTPEGTGEPPAALNRGGKIFLLFGAGALVVGAAAIGTILTVSKRASAKEAYTYKNSTRRRK